MIVLPNPEAPPCGGFRYAGKAKPYGLNCFGIEARRPLVVSPRITVWAISAIITGAFNIMHIVAVSLVTVLVQTGEAIGVGFAVFPVAGATHLISEFDGFVLNGANSGFKGFLDGVSVNRGNHFTDALNLFVQHSNFFGQFNGLAACLVVHTSTENNANI